jgi:hypothetical protein
MAPILGYLIANGLPLVANAVMTAGKQKVEQALGVKLPDMTSGGLTPEQLFALKKIEAERPEKLLALALEEKRIEQQGEAAEAQEITKRWQADMTSDSWMAKNIRPASLAYVLLALTAFAVGSGAGFDIQNAYIDIFGNLAMALVISYVGGRSVEKGLTIWTRSKR